jgi:hypothetical protein
MHCLKGPGCFTLTGWLYLSNSHLTSGAEFNVRSDWSTRIGRTFHWPEEGREGLAIIYFALH